MSYLLPTMPNGTLATTVLSALSADPNIHPPNNLTLPQWIFLAIIILIPLVTIILSTIFLGDTKSTMNIISIIVKIIVLLPLRFMYRRITVYLFPVDEENQIKQ